MSCAVQQMFPAKPVHRQESLNKANRLPDRVLNRRLQASDGLEPLFSPVRISKRGASLALTARKRSWVSKVGEFDVEGGTTKQTKPAELTKQT